MKAIDRAYLKQDQITYKKVGRKYVPINDPCAYDGLREGWWLVNVKPGSTSIRSQVHPSRAEIDAAIREKSDQIREILIEASKSEITNGRPVSPELQKDWNDLISKHGKEMSVAYYPSIHDISEKIITKLTSK
jgi:hypothetical protein